LTVPKVQAVHARTLAALLALAAIAAGCGSSDEDKVKSVLKDYNAALVDGDGKKACGLFTSDGQKKLAASLKALAPTAASSDCAQLVRDVSATITDDNGKRIKAIAIKNVKVKGNTASATSGVETQLAKDGGDWKITDFAGSSDSSSAAAASGSAAGAPAGCTKVAAPSPTKGGKGSAPKTRLDAAKTNTLTFATNCGSFTIRLDPKKAPKAAASVYALAKKGFYAKTVFHRIVPGFVIQGGDPTGTGSGGAGYTTVDKPSAGTKYTHGVVAMAKGPSEPAGSASSQFFVVTGKDVGLPPDYAVIGKVTTGLDTVDRIGKLGDSSERPTFTVVIKKVTAKTA
jgi:peptidyl-prolyl cis-trans isomerase B (cyclophilin B)